MVMRSAAAPALLTALLISLASSSSSFSFQALRRHHSKVVVMSAADQQQQQQQQQQQRHPHCDLPGDPSLFLTTNVNLGDNKGAILKELSSLVASVTKKPETYVAVSITDNASMVFGGSDAPLALGCLYSIGAITMANNGKIQSGVTDALEKFGVTQDRIYINFFDVPRDCVGWNRATFAG